MIIQRIRAMFDLNADWTAIAPSLRGDPILAERVDAAPGLRVPGCWNGFELTVRAILGQQISVKAATAIAGRIAADFGRTLLTPVGLTHLFPTPEVLAEANPSRFGLPKARAQTLRRLARAVCEQRISFDQVKDSEELLAGLCQIPGIGPWTAQYVAMRSLRDTDAFPSADLGLLRAAGCQSARDLERRAEAWRPWRAYAAMYLWNVAGAGYPSEDAREPVADANSRAAENTPIDYAAASTP